MHMCDEHSIPHINYAEPIPMDSPEPILQYFAFAHLPEYLQAVSEPFAVLANQLTSLPRNPERSVALRKLLEAKDAAVRARLTKEA
jgi:hypothetical protein